MPAPSDGPSGDACVGAEVWLLADTGEVDDAALLGACETLLDGDERDRLSTFGADTRRREFVLGHALARVALQRLHGSVAAADWRLRVGAGGRPEARGPGGAAPALGIAHTRGLLVTAVAPGGEVGVDVEWCGRRPPALELAARFFAAAELASIRDASEAARVERFLAFWTMKEAYLKARGVGLRLPLRDIVFRVPDSAAPPWRAGAAADESGTAIEVGFAPSLNDRSARWTFRQWAHIGGHLIGFAHGAESAPRAPRRHELDRAGLFAAVRAASTSR